MGGGGGARCGGGEGGWENSGPALPRTGSGGLENSRPAVPPLSTLDHLGAWFPPRSCDRLIG